MEYLLFFVKCIAASTFLVALYFLIVTRGSLIIQSLYKEGKSSSHIYWIYSNSFLIWLTDRSFIISAILLFNYHKLVDGVIGSLNPTLEGKNVLQVSCAFGNISQRLVEQCAREGAKRVVICDIIPNEIRHTRTKLAGTSLDNGCYLLIEDGNNIAHKDESFDYVVLFFLFHELPLERKERVSKEAARVLKPGGRIVFGEFHKPEPWLLRSSGSLFFKVFEPYAREMWDSFDPVRTLTGETSGRWEFSKRTYFWGNYQVFSATKV
ncbi:MAG: methyltransferase domain-containing protein [Deltaproteobacteria bacterium]|nr:methyltransferase domain-containing protein [Deltaproteobacteria bacterium]